MRYVRPAARGQPPPPKPASGTGAPAALIPYAIRTLEVCEVEEAVLGVFPRPLPILVIVDRSMSSSKDMKCLAVSAGLEDLVVTPET